MTAEILSIPGEHLPASRPEYKTPASRILESPHAERVFCDFMWQFVGSPNVFERMGTGIPVVERISYDGVEPIRYDEPLVSGVTQLGRLVHVRVNRSRPELYEKYFVVVGDLETGELREAVVVDEPSTITPDGRLETTLFLHDADCEAKGWPKELRPSIRMTQQGFYYCPGFNEREEQTIDPGVLVRECESIRPSRHLYIVPETTN